MMSCVQSCGDLGRLQGCFASSSIVLIRLPSSGDVRDLHWNRLSFRRDIFELHWNLLVFQSDVLGLQWN